ncbi:hypothetical protein B0H66DRAFT_359793 [Apodospora peruviana]|uniref:Uncharacterized protein n=1 Tax=Apodospora peruviana TaxID=516989 RepID=A0AAE0HVM9_9PEZI|nr:hypothetical protein B0H66DRAFT_359793 [Apodospora peruviana]
MCEEASTAHLPTPTDETGSTYPDIDNTTMGSAVTTAKDVAFNLVRPRQITDATTPSSSDQSPNPPGGRPLPQPRTSFGLLPVPLSAFVVNHWVLMQAPQRGWEPRCTHSMVTRVYGHDLACDRCKRPAQFGWLYRCTMDREALIMDARAKGQQVAFDEIGNAFAKEMTLGKYGPDIRREPGAFFNEITPEQLSSYTRDQVDTILEQRANVQRKIAEDRSRPTDHPTCNEYGLKYPDDNRPWMPDEKYECAQKFCHHCNYVGHDKAMLGLNAVLKGEIKPSLATGFAFNLKRSRPIADPEIVRKIGYRPVPMAS